MTNRMISATDALFTLNSSLEQHTSDNTSSAGGADGVTGVCFVRDPTKSTLGPKSMNHSHDESDGSGSSNDDRSDCENSDDDCQPLQFRCSNLLLGPQHPAHTDEGTGHGIVESYQHEHTYLPLPITLCREHFWPLVTKMGLASFGTWLQGVVLSMIFVRRIREEVLALHCAVLALVETMQVINFSIKLAILLGQYLSMI